MVIYFYRFQKGKVLLMMAVFSWISFTLPIGFIHPPVVSCKWYNSTSKKFMLKEPNWDKAPSVIQIPYLPNLPSSGRRKRSLHEDDFIKVNYHKRVAKIRYVIKQWKIITFLRSRHVFRRHHYANLELYFLLRINISCV